MARSHDAEENGDSLRISWDLDASQVKQGPNIVEATLREAKPGAGESVQLTQLRLVVRYTP